MKRGTGLKNFAMILVQIQTIGGEGVLRFRNRKEKHRDSKNGYPVAKLIWIDWKYQADIPQYKSCHTAKTNRVVHLSPQPLKGEVCLNKFISRSNYKQDDEFKTDFSIGINRCARLSSGIPRTDCIQP